MCEPMIEWYNYYGIQFFYGTPPLKVGAQPMSKTMETEKTIFHLLPRPLLYIERERRPVARNCQVCQVLHDLFLFGPIGLRLTAAYTLCDSQVTANA